MEKNIIDSMHKQTYKVLVRCATYNQCKYIEEALNGFAMQQTNFPFVCLVMDDASTDGEQEVIKSWMERECDMDRAETIDIPTTIVIIVPHKKNSSCTFAFYFLKQNLYGTGKKKKYIDPWREKCEYEALCEGDDYWTDSMKLQKQFDFMDQHNDCSLCFHAYEEIYNDGSKKTIKTYKSSLFYCPKKDIINKPGSIMATNTMFYRINLLTDYPEWARTAPIGDAPLALVLTVKGNVAYINEVMGCYRIASVGSWTSKMSSDFSKKEKHYYGIMKMWKSFDEWSDYRFHKNIVLNLKINKLRLIKLYIKEIIKVINM